MASRRSNKRKRRRRGRFGFLYKLLSLAIILVVVAAGCVVFFRVEQITVEGEGRYTAQGVIDASGVELGANLFLVNRAGTAQRIYTALSYVDNVSTRPALPDGLVIRITERSPAAVVQGGEGWWIIDKKGMILEQAPSGTVEGLARVTGLTVLLPAVGTRVTVEDADALRLESLLALLQAIETWDMAAQVSEVDLTAAADLLMTYDGRFTVRIPMNADFNWKLRTLDGVMRELQPNESGTIDLTREDEVRVIPNYG